MKKQQLKNLNLKKYRISNLTILHRKSGGNVGADAELTTTTIGMEPSGYPECTTSNPSNVTDCHTSLFVDCECNTNTGITKAQPPSEHQNCKPNGFAHE
ncbi:MAG: hypothetical protein AAF611_12545 [Bacteroidota bacterium]